MKSLEWPQGSPTRRAHRSRFRLHLAEAPASIHITAVPLAAAYRGIWCQINPKMR